ncbi:zinc-binding dehydrogenase [Streptomyces sp. NPDC048361]|uniref:zinc-binding dehydrogenase n=1 Tax=Streptomyces sp. NPDC048361 TaxID=3154720 RepID=UPI00344A9744
MAPGTNSTLDISVAARGAVVAYYGGGEDERLCVPVLSSLAANLRWQSVFVYTVPAAAKQQALTDVAAAVDEGALRVGEEVGMPLHHFTLEQAAEAHAALEQGVVGKILLDIP